MFETEVDYRLAKWLLANMKHDGVISDAEMQTAWEKIAEHYNPPFLEIDTVGGEIGDGVTVGKSSRPSLRCQSQPLLRRRQKLRCVWLHTREYPQTTRISSPVLKHSRNIIQS